MEDLRLALLKDTNTTNIENLIWELSEEDVYDEFCDFLDKCDVLHIEVADSVREFVVNFILQYRQENNPPTRNEDELSIEGRIELVKEILEEYLNDSGNFSDDKKIQILLFLARIMNELRFKEKGKELKGIKERQWDELRFLICVFVAIKTDDTHTKYPIINFFFQFFIDEEVILNILKKTLEILKNHPNSEEWTDLETIYKPTRCYYELRKICLHLDHIQSTKFDEYSKNELILIRHFQQIGESLTVIEKLGFIKGKKQPMEIPDTFALKKTINIIFLMRNQLSHAKSNQEDISNSNFKNKLEMVFMKMYVHVFDMIKEQQISILGTFISKWIAETDNTKLESKIERINTERINNWSQNETDRDKMKWFSEFVKKHAYSAVSARRGWLRRLFQKLSNEFDEENFGSNILNLEEFNLNIIIFFRNLKGLGAADIKLKLKYLKDNVEELTSTQRINLSGVLDITKRLFSTFPADDDMVLNEPGLQCVFNEVGYFDKAVNKSEDYIIEYIMEITINAIDNLEEKQKFKELRKSLLLKRHLYQMFKIIGSSQYIQEHWPKNEKINVSEINKYEDPLNCIVRKANFLPDFKVVECFIILLKRKKIILLKNERKIVENVREIEEIRLRNRLLSIKRELEENKSNQFAKEMVVLDGFEVLKLLGKELIGEPNYMDFHCILPMGRALRNYLAHGDVYLDLFLTQTDKQTILEKQLEEIFDHQVNHSVSRKVYLSYLKERFTRQQSWIETFIAPLNLSAEIRYPSGHIGSKEDFSVAMRVRDVQGRNYVQHNFGLCDRSNSFFMFLVQSLIFNNENLRERYEELEEESEDKRKIYRKSEQGENYKVTKELNQTEIYDKMIEESRCSKERSVSSKLIYPENGCTLRDYFINEFINETDMNTKQILLCKIISINCLKWNVFQQLFVGLDDHYVGFSKLACLYKQPEIVEYIIDRYGIKEKSVLEECFPFAVVGNNLQAAEYLLKKGVSIELKLITATFLSHNFEMTKLLLQNVSRLDFSIIRSLNFIEFSKPDFCEYLVKKYPGMINYNHSILLFKACGWKSERFLKFLVEEGVNLNTLYNGTSILVAACVCFDDLEVIKYLVEKGAKVNTRMNTSAFMIACQEGNVEIAKYLLTKGANPFVEYDVRCPLNFAINKQSIEISDELFNRGIKINEDTAGTFIAFVTATFFNYLVQKDGNINWIIKSLDLATISKNMELFNEMLNYLKDKKIYLTFHNFLHSIKNEYFYIYLKYPYYELTENEWSQLLILSLYYQDFDKMKVIISKGANIKYTDRDKRNCLHLLFLDFEFYDNSVLRLFLLHGADISTQDKDQVTPIQIAARKLDEQSFQEVLKIILETRDVDIKIQLPLISSELKFHLWALKQILKYFEQIKLFFFRHFVSNIRNIN